MRSFYTKHPRQSSTACESCPNLCHTTHIRPKKKHPQEIVNGTSCSISRWLFTIYDLRFRNLASLRLAKMRSVSEGSGENHKGRWFERGANHAKLRPRLGHIVLLTSYTVHRRHQTPPPLCNYVRSRLYEYASAFALQFPQLRCALFANRKS